MPQTIFQQTYAVAHTQRRFLSQTLPTWNAYTWPPRSTSKDLFWSRFYKQGIRDIVVNKIIKLRWFLNLSVTVKQGREDLEGPWGRGRQTGKGKNQIVGTLHSIWSYFLIKVPTQQSMFTLQVHVCTLVYRNILEKVAWAKRWRRTSEVCVQERLPIFYTPRIILTRYPLYFLYINCVALFRDRHTIASNKVCFVIWSSCLTHRLTQRRLGLSLSWSCDPPPQQNLPPSHPTSPPSTCWGHRGFCGSKVF